MLGQLHFDDHAGFQRNTLYWTVAGSAGALLGLIARHYAVVSGSVPAGQDHVFLLAMVGMGIGAASGFFQGQWSKVGLGAGLGMALGVAAAMLAGVTALGGAAPWIGAAVAGLGLGIFFGPEAAPRNARAVGYALASVLGLYVTTRLVLTQNPVLDVLGTPGLQDAATGAMLGFFLSLGGVVGRFRLEQDPVKDLWAQTREQLTGDMRELAGQGVRLYEEILERIKKRRSQEGQDSNALTEAHRVSTETTTRLIRLANRWCEIESSYDDTTRPRLEARRKATEEKLKGVNDPVIRAEYTAVLETIDEQLQSFGRIDIARERLVARMHRCLASLERVSLRILQLSTSDAQDASLSLQPELERLDEMSEELSWKSLSVDDLLAASAPAPVKAQAPVPAEPQPQALAQEVAQEATELQEEVSQEAPAEQEVKEPA